MSSKTNPICIAPTARRKVGQTYCQGQLGQRRCADRGGCALHTAYLTRPEQLGPLDLVYTLPFVGGQSCHYFKAVVKK